MSDVNLVEGIQSDAGITIQDTGIFEPVAVGPLCINDGERELLLSVSDDGHLTAELSVAAVSVCTWDFDNPPVYADGYDKPKAIECLRALFIRIIKGGE